MYVPTVLQISYLFLIFKNDILLLLFLNFFELKNSPSET